MVTEFVVVFALTGIQCCFLVCVWCVCVVCVCVCVCVVCAHLCTSTSNKFVDMVHVQSQNHMYIQLFNNLV